MSISIVQLGTARADGEGLRIGTVRRPPRGVPKAEFASRDYYDTWLPLLAPSGELMAEGKAAESDADWARFAKRYRAEMEGGEGARVLDLLSALSHSSHFAVGCYCENEARCHRSVLRQLLAERGASIR
ncbi:MULTISPECIES: DUF488 domain-containing protein [unclassified Pseudomonas]|uniref:DUF488 domain-containing protein n=1 Tax=unclassified Pseudomonas TaxID=196821 RepID=UPI00129D9885|nr:MULTISPECIES: DUF488 family protein [unclassified Pseudomonas]MDH4654412.1 DUF488 family protein [Pseudomonas sp. BN606]MRK21200.1 DUF488 family protein [Pseudomonas sp. JG-B]